MFVLGDMKDMSRILGVVMDPRVHAQVSAQFSSFSFGIKLFFLKKRRAR